MHLEFTMYRFDPGSSVSIGSNPDNEIRYDKDGMVSRNHALIRSDLLGHVTVHDLSSRTGMSVNGIQTVQAKLNVGDTVAVCGLKMILLPGLLGVNCSDGACICKMTPEENLPDENEPYENVPDENVPGENVPGEKALKIPPASAFVLQGTDSGIFVRSPRIMKTLDAGTVEIDAPPSVQKDNNLTVQMRFGPSLVMGLLAFVLLAFTLANQGAGSTPISRTANVTLALILFIGALLGPFLMNRNQRQADERAASEQREKYMNYIRMQREDLERKKERSTQILNEIHHMSPQRVLAMLGDPSEKRRLWERSAADADFLDVRLGTGRLPFDVKVTVQKKGFMVDSDDLAQEPYRLQEAFETLEDVPVTVSLCKERTLGLVGNPENIRELLACTIIQLTAMHDPESLKLVFVASEADYRQFGWMRNLPHAWSTDKAVRLIATNQEEVHYLFRYLDDSLTERETQRNTEEGTAAGQKCVPENGAAYVFIILEPALVENEPLMRYVQHSGNTVGVSGIFAYGSLELLPRDSRAIVQVDGTVCGLYVKDKRENRFLTFRPDRVTGTECGMYRRILSGIRMKSSDLHVNVPESVSFLGMYRVGRVDDLQIARRWRESQPHKSLAAPIGIRSGGEPFLLDIHESYHGPHGLMAGMTGSGKSEFLLTYILSMAVNFHPHDVSFVLIDYKGGGMANSLAGLPHLAGTITNLSGNLLRRSLVAIRAEMRRRQHLFAQVGVNHIDKYQKLWKEDRVDTPLPHLILISDEFAQLKSQQPEFMQGLIDVAQIGRSLGVHLILATQKPAGVVDEQIWGNSRFRVCLKVLDRRDSMEMIRRPDAASIKLPGRCFIQVGYDEIFDQVQSGYCGKDYIPEKTFMDASDRQVSLIGPGAVPIRMEELPGVSPKSGFTQLEALLYAVREEAVRAGIRPLTLWMPQLPEVVALESLRGGRFFSEPANVTDPLLGSSTRGDAKAFSGFDGERWVAWPQWMAPVIGLADVPEEQRQIPLVADIGKKGHLAVYGATGTGKTTFLQTLLFSLAWQYSPDEVHFHIFDFGGRTLGYFMEAPHCGRVVYADDETGITNVLYGLTAEVERRRFLFSEQNVGGIEAYVQATGLKVPAIVLCIDQYVVLHERYPKLEENLVMLARDGRTYGIFLVLTGSTKTSIYYRVTDYFKYFLTLQMNDRYNYREIMGPTGDLEPDAVPGRGLAVDGRLLEFQTALAVPQPSEALRVNLIKAELQTMADAWEGSKPCFT